MLNIISSFITNVRFFLFCNASWPYAVLSDILTLNWQGDTRLQRSDFGIFCVIVNGCTFSTPYSASLKMPKSNLLEVEESDSGRFPALQGAWTTCTGCTRREKQHGRIRKQPCPDRICPCQFRVLISNHKKFASAKIKYTLLTLIVLK